MEVLKEDGTCFDGDLDAVKDILKNADSVGDNEKWVCTVVRFHKF